ncbi:hypothetical protein D3880_11400 [Pseudomonas cavernae]|uniref:Uncharacterized protein n=2 Tax=Pseudomonas cavernae TaxID=2320867 RepID=A0A385Z4S1_9PSED|nr:hypothetical protein D3880_11400 [Pseudomonas cavernae]
MALAGDQPDPQRPIEVNQTDGFGNERLVAFTYFMNFDCVHGPFDNFDNNKDELGNPKVAAVDPDQFQTGDPQARQTSGCVVGVQPGLDPAGKPVEQTEKLFVIVPFFDKGGEAATPELTGALRQLFGFVPEAFNPTPQVAVQCPEPGLPLTQHQGAFGTCTMHPKQLDLGPVLTALGKNPDATPLNVPLPNHSHIIRGANFGAVWWQIIVVLINDANFWPDANGMTPTGQMLNSVEALRAVQAAGKASADVPSNFFLFFDSRQFQH